MNSIFDRMSCTADNSAFFLPTNYFTFLKMCCVIFKDIQIHICSLRFPLAGTPFNEPHPHTAIEIRCAHLAILCARRHAAHALTIYFGLIFLYMIKDMSIEHWAANNKMDFKLLKRNISCTEKLNRRKLLCIPFENFSHQPKAMHSPKVFHVQSGSTFFPVWQLLLWSSASDFHQTKNKLELLNSFCKTYAI